MRLEDLARLPCVLRATVQRPGFELRAVHCDSRQVDGRTGFLALRGLQTDGHRFLDAARAAGAPVLLVSDLAHYRRLTAQPLETLAGVILVRPGRTVLAELAAEVYGWPARHLSLLGVTGTNGKTTVTHLAAQMLAGLGKRCAILGTLGMNIWGEPEPGARTTPEAPEIQEFLRRCVAARVQAAAMEVSSIGIALERSRGLPFSAAAFTNLTRDHLDFHGDWDAYREAKFRLFLEYDTQAAVVNLDDAAGRMLAERLRAAGRGARLVTYSLDGRADLFIDGQQADGEEMRGVLRYRGMKAAFRYRLLGRFNLYNLLAAVGLLLAAGYPLPDLAGAAEGCQGARGRFERVALDAPFTVVVDYAHSPDALENLLRAARPLAGGCLQVLFGCGGDRDRAKRPMMGGIAERLADRIVLSNDNPRGEDPQAILAEIAAGMNGSKPMLQIADRREAIWQLLDQAVAGDVILIAGKGDETYQEIAGKNYPFDDRQVVRDWAASRGRQTG